jgi:thioredoxin reductase (NADPH)
MLAHYMLQHTLNAGAALRQAVDVTAIDLDRREVVLDDVETIRAKKIIIATGSSPRPLGVQGEQEYKGRGISYCATCDAKYYEGKHVVVIGGGNSAIEEALFIAKFAARITVVHQFAELQANKQAQEAAFANEKISFIFGHEPRVFEPRGSTIGAVQIEELSTGERRTLECDGVFVFAGMQPNLELFNGELERDDFGYLRVDEQMHTNVPDVFAAGDIRSKIYRQMTTAVADGTVAAMTIARELGA